MKELSIEEKARAYDEALERAKNYWKSPRTCFDIDALTEMFPELKDTDDTIRRELIKYFEHYSGGDTICIKFPEWIAWLKKQGEQKPILDFKAKDWYVSKVDGKIHNIYHSVDKVEPKFHEGDWVVTKGLVLKIQEVRNDLYETILQNDELRIFDTYILDNDAHLWTIQDAKDGDVLIDKNYMGESPFIFKETKPSNIKTDVPNPLTVLGYCGIGGAGFTKSSGWGDTANCIYYPATKEQRELLFQKIKESGYEWDIEKKELKKIENEIEIPFGAKYSELQEATYSIPEGFHAEIEGDKVIIKKGKQKPTEWSKVDEVTVTGIINDIQKRLEDYPTEQLAERYFKEIKWLKSLKERYGWKPSDGQLHDLKRAIDSFTFEPDYLEELYEDLKKLKGG